MKHDDIRFFAEIDWQMLTTVLVVYLKHGWDFVSFLKVLDAFFAKVLPSSLSVLSDRIFKTVTIGLYVNVVSVPMTYGGSPIVLTTYEYCFWLLLAQLFQFWCCLSFASLLCKLLSAWWESMKCWFSVVFNLRSLFIVLFAFRIWRLHVRSSGLIFAALSCRVRLEFPGAALLLSASFILLVVLLCIRGSGFFLLSRCYSLAWIDFNTSRLKYRTEDK